MPGRALCKRRVAWQIMSRVGAGAGQQESRKTEGRTAQGAGAVRAPGARLMCTALPTLWSRGAPRRLPFQTPFLSPEFHFRASMYTRTPIHGSTTIPFCHSPFPRFPHPLAEFPTFSVTTLISPVFTPLFRPELGRIVQRCSVEVSTRPKGPRPLRFSRPETGPVGRQTKRHRATEPLLHRSHSWPSFHSTILQMQLRTSRPPCMRWEEGVVTCLRLACAPQKNPGNPHSNAEKRLPPYLLAWIGGTQWTLPNCSILHAQG